MNNEQRQKKATDKGSPELDPEALIKEQTAADFMDLTPRCLQAWRVSGNGPKFVRLGSRCVRYRRKDLIAFANARVAVNTIRGGEK